MDAMTIDRDGIKWSAKARFDLFTPESVEECRVALGLDREPIGPELLAWAEATRGEARGDEVHLSDGNTMTRLGRRRNIALYSGDTATASQALNAAHMRIGLGDSSTPTVDTDTDLGAAAGATHRQFKTVDSVTGGSGASSGVMTVVATFGSTVANFVAGVNEWGIDGGTVDGTTVTADTASTPGLQNHKITSPAPIFTKSTGAVVAFTGVITLT